MEDERPMLPSESGGGNVDFDTQLATACEQYFSQKIEFRLATKGDSHLEQLRNIYQPLNKVVSQAADTEKAENDQVTKQTWTDGIPEPKVMLFDPEKLQMTWKQPRAIGAALVNVGNTCFFNSVIQCLTYTPPIISYLHTGDHHEKCQIQGFCALCEFRQHCLKVQSANSSVVQPKLVYHLKAIGKNFRLGRQEDAHEFLRYFVDALQQSCLKMHTSPEKLDAFSKATTVIHQVFGGFHRSRVVCLECKKVSDTYDPLLDISLDINFCSTLMKALQHSTKADLLDGNNRYACPHCKKMTNAHKMFTVHRPPNVLTIHLKRFDFSRGLGVKLGTSIDYGEYLDIRPYTSDNSGAPLWYRLYALVEHLGFSIHSGHYICYVRNSNGIWYCMNDAKVSQTSISNVLRREAYLLFYIRDHEHMPPTKGGPQAFKPSATTVQGAKMKEDSSFLRTPNKPPSVGIPFKPPGMATPFMKSKLVRPMGVVSPSTSSSQFRGPAPTIPSTTPAPTIPSTSSTPTIPSTSPAPTLTPSTSSAPTLIQHCSIRLNRAQVGKTLNLTPQRLATVVSADSSQHGGSGVPQGCGPIMSSVQLTPEGGVTELKKTYPTGADKQHITGGTVLEPALCDAQSTTVTSNGSRAVAERQGVLDSNQPVVGGAHHDQPVVGGAHYEKTSLSSGLSHCSDFYVPSKSSKIAMVTPQVAVVSPQPHVSTKPVARVLPNPKPLPLDLSERPQLNTKADSEDSSESDGGTAPLVVTQHTKTSETTQVACSTIPYGPALPKDYSVATVPLSPSSTTHHTSPTLKKPSTTHHTSPTLKKPSSTTHHTSPTLKKLKKKKKKKKSRKKKNRSHSDEEHGDEEVEDIRGKKVVSGSERHKHTPSEESSEGGWIPADNHCSKPGQSKKWTKNQSSSSVVTNEHSNHHSRAAAASGHSNHHSRAAAASGHISPDLEPKGNNKHKSANVVSKVQEECSGLKGPVVVEWDDAARGRGQVAKWDGCHQSDVVEKLIAHSHNKIGTMVKSWDGGENSIDSCVSGKHKRPRDDWDEELDRGKVKKVKGTHKKDTSKSSKNAFQDFQNKKFLHTTTNRLKSPFHPHHKHIHHHPF